MTYNSQFKKNKRWLLAWWCNSYARREDTYGLWVDLLNDRESLMEVLLEYFHDMADSLVDLKRCDRVTHDLTETRLGC